jgi:hypothetical protein
LPRQVVRKEVRAWDKDRYMSPDISKVKNMLREEKIWNAVKLHLDNYQRAQVILASHKNLPTQDQGGRMFVRKNRPK